MTSLHEVGVPAETVNPLLLEIPAQFPAVRYSDAGAYFDAYTAVFAQAAASVDQGAIDRAAAVLVDAYSRERTVFTCGNGGSASIANHMQCDHIKGVSAATDLSPRVVSLSTNIELLTAIANDCSYSEVFARQLRTQARAGDVLVAVSSSGRSQNIVRGLRWARENGLRTIALTGFCGGEARALAEVSVHVDGTNYGVVEDVHQAIMHALAQYIRHARMTASAIKASVF